MGRPRRVADRQALVALWVQAYIEGSSPKLKEQNAFRFAPKGRRDFDAAGSGTSASAHSGGLSQGADAAEAPHSLFFGAEETEIYAPIRALEDREPRKLSSLNRRARGNLLIIGAPGPLAITKAADGGLPVAPDLLAYAELRYRGTDQALEAAELLLPESSTMPRFEPAWFQS